MGCCIREQGSEVSIWILIGGRVRGKVRKLHSEGPDNLASPPQNYFRVIVSLREEVGEPCGTVRWK